MTPEILIGLAALVVSALIYFAGVQRGIRQARAQQTHEEKLERERNERQLASKVADEYVALVRNSRDAGPHAMVTLGLHGLKSDTLIRQAIHEMEVRTGRNPWGGEEQHVHGLDLVEFFRLAAENQVNFFESTVEQHATSVRAKSQVGNVA
jgi:hypothetical protein